MPSSHLRSTFIWVLAALALALVVLLLTARTLPALAAPAAGPPEQSADQGQQVFQSKCTGCHTIGKGKLVGPDLQGVTQQRDAQWIKNFIANPGAMLDSDPAAQQLLKEYNGTRMPTLGLPATEVNALFAFLEKAGGTAGGGGATGGQGAGAGVAGNAAAGSLMFTGQTGLGTGGPACIGCHTVEGTGSLGGGSLGPDLTHVAGRLGGQAGLSAALTTIAFPTMAGPFLNRPLSAAENANLVAFLVQADQQQPPVPVFAPGAVTPRMWLILGLALLGGVALFVLLSFFWPRQRQSIAVRLRNSSRSQRP